MNNVRITEKIQRYNPFSSFLVNGREELSDTGISVMDFNYIVYQCESQE